MKRMATLSVLLVFGAFLLLPGLALAQETKPEYEVADAEGFIKAVDAKGNLITMADGTKLVVDENSVLVKVIETLELVELNDIKVREGRGPKVLATYEKRGDKNVITRLEIAPRQ